MMKQYHQHGTEQSLLSSWDYHLMVVTSPEEVYSYFQLNLSCHINNYI